MKRKICNICDGAFKLSQFRNFGRAKDGKTNSCNRCYNLETIIIGHYRAMLLDQDDLVIRIAKLVRKLQKS